MSLKEFAFIDLIKQSQATLNNASPYIDIGIGDDAAALNIPNNQSLVVSTDTLVDQVHFDQRISIADLAYKSLAVNLSDIAAMGATPIAFTLNITAPALSLPWCEAYLKGVSALAEKHQVALIGGDTTKGPLTLTLTAYGVVEKGKAIQRSQAKVGDRLFVSGHLGEAAFCLKHADKPAINMTALYRPEPQVALGRALQGIANAMIDLSDGLSSDLKHILHASQVGAIVNADDIPIAKPIQKTLSAHEALQFALHGGEDYQLCFTVPAEKLAQIETLKKTFPDIYDIGEVTEAQNYHLKQGNQTIALSAQGYQHFN